MLAISSQPPCVNTMGPRQNGRHFADDIFKCIFLNENVWIAIKISLKSIPKDPIKNIPALVLIMAWCRPGNICASLGLNELSVGDQGSWAYPAGPLKYEFGTRSVHCFFLNTCGGPSLPTTSAEGMLCQCLVSNTSLKLNSLWPSDIIWQHRSVSPLAQVMARCLRYYHPKNILINLTILALKLEYSGIPM